MAEAPRTGARDAQRPDGGDYTRRLVSAQLPRWKTLLDVQAPYRWNLRRLEPGFILDIGCGIGRNLHNLAGHGVGVDVNAESVRVARERGFTAFTPEELRASEYYRPGRFDTLLLAHVVEHMSLPTAVEVIREYVPLLRSGGSLVLIAPQERGFRTDPTHVEFMDFGKLASIERALGFSPVRAYSFPFPRVVGRVFPHNEFVSVSRKP
jgi:SAM-dependent methyltransferase